MIKLLCEDEKCEKLKNNSKDITYLDVRSGEGVGCCCVCMIYKMEIVEKLIQYFIPYGDYWREFMKSEVKYTHGFKLPYFPVNDFMLHDLLKTKKLFSYTCKPMVKNDITSLNSTIN